MEAQFQKTDVPSHGSRYSQACFGREQSRNEWSIDSLSCLQRRQVGDTALWRRWRSSIVSNFLCFANHKVNEGLESPLNLQTAFQLSSIHSAACWSKNFQSDADEDTSELSKRHLGWSSCNIGGSKPSLSISYPCSILFQVWEVGTGKSSTVRSQGIQSAILGC